MEKDNENIAIPLALYSSTRKKFSEEIKKGNFDAPEAFLLFMFFYECTVRQNTNRIYCTSKFGLDKSGLSYRKYFASKKLLVEMGLITPTAFDKIQNQYYFDVVVSRETAVFQKELDKIRNSTVDAEKEQGCLSKRIDPYLSRRSNNTYTVNKNHIQSKDCINRLGKNQDDKPQLIKKVFDQKPELEKKPILVKKEILASKPALVKKTFGKPDRISIDPEEKLVNKIPKYIADALEYWNSKGDVLRKHMVDPYDPSKTIKHCMTLIRDFFSGKLVENVLLPNGFKVEDWKYKNPSLDDWKYLVDEIVYCINDPHLLPKKNGARLDLITFMEGNSRMDIPSYLFNFCVGDYKTAIPDQDPKNKERVKKFWKEIIGEFKSTPENERAFTIISNLSVKIFNERRTKNKNWIPAMNEYHPANIVKSILRQNLWIKEKKRQPEYMATNFFKGMVERYDYDRKTGKFIF